MCDYFSIILRHKDVIRNLNDLFLLVSCSIICILCVNLQIFGTPRNHPKSQPFVDHVLSCSVADNRIWFRNYQILEENAELAEIGKIRVVPSATSHFLQQTLLLPPASEGWGKVMFSLVSVSVHTPCRTGYVRSGRYASCGLAGGLSCFDNSGTHTLLSFPSGRSISNKSCCM